MQRHPGLAGHVMGVVQHVEAALTEMSDAGEIDDHVRRHGPAVRAGVRHR
ncbi:hypothetical protein [Pseudonocardia sp. GCM10023141]